MKWPRPAMSPSEFEKRTKAKYLNNRYAVSMESAIQVLDELEFKDLPLSLCGTIFELSIKLHVDAPTLIPWIERIRCAQ